MFKSKRGLSAIVATLIVVLLAIVAFGIISGFIQDVVTQRTSEAELASSNTRLNIQKASVKGNMSSVSVRREGSGSLEVVGARVVFDSGDGRAVSSSNFSIGKQELDTFSMPLCSEEFSDVDFSSEDLSATVYPIVMYEDERTMIDGNPSSVDFVEVNGPNLVENCNKSQSSESASESESEGESGEGSDSSQDGAVSDDSSSDEGSSDSDSGTGEGSDGSGQQASPSRGNFEVIERESQTFFMSGSGDRSKPENITLENTAGKNIFIRGEVKGPASDYVTISNKAQVMEQGESQFKYTAKRPNTKGEPIEGVLVLNTRSVRKEVNLVIEAR